MPLVPVSQRVGYTIEEVAEHNTAKSLWVIINRKVYDVTMFHKWHPGGASVLLQMGGKDATAAAAAAHKNALPANLMWEYCIGSIVRFKVAQEPATAPRVSTKAKAKAAGSALKGKKVEQSQPSKANPESPVGSAESSPRPAPMTASSPRTESKASVQSAEQAERGSSMAMGEGSAGSPLAATAQALSPPEDPQLAVKKYLLELMQADSRLKSFFETANMTALDNQLSLFLAGAFDGAAWPQITVRRQVVEKHFPALATKMWEGMRAPLPLGEDTLVAAVAGLTKQTLAECDPPVARLFEAIRDILLFGPGSPASSAQSSPRPTSTKIAALAGKWSTSDGSSVVVADGTCTIDGKVSHTLAMQGNLVAFNGYTTSSTPSGQTLLWKHSSGKKIEWYRA